MHLCCLLTFGIICEVGACWSQGAPVAEDLPKTVWYNTNDELRVNIALRNVPPAAVSYQIFEISEPETHGQLISMHHQGELPDNHVVQLTVTLDRSKSHSIFEMTLKTSSRVCNTMENRKFVKIIYTNVDLTYRSDKKCLNRACKITLDWNNECENFPASAHDIAEPASLKVTPAALSEADFPFAVFKCTASRRGPLDMLVWYQEKVLNAKPSILNISVPIDHDGTVRMAATLNKSLSESDQGSKIYCGRTFLTRNDNNEIIIDEGGEISNKITLAFNRTIQSIIPKIEVVLVNTAGNSPRESVLQFEPNSTLMFECRCSTLLDGRNLTWYEEDPDDSTKQRKYAFTQASDPFSNSRKLTLHFDESSRGKSIYCTQEYHTQYRGADGVFYLLRYGEIARSDVITLRPRGMNAKAEGSFLKDKKLVVAATCVATALAILLAAGLVMAVWRAHGQGQDQDQDSGATEYVVPQVTYAVLDLAPSTGAAPKKPEKPYVKIVGYYKDKPNKK